MGERYPARTARIAKRRNYCSAASRNAAIAVIIAFGTSASSPGLERHDGSAIDGGKALGVHAIGA
jgi:hypothetical protein